MKKKVDKIVKLLDKSIKLNEESNLCMKQMILYFIVKKHFPADIVKGHTFFAIKRKDYQKEYMWGYRHGVFEMKGAMGIKGRTRTGEPAMENILILCVETKEWIEVPHFELPKSEKNVFKFAREPKKAMAYDV